MNPQHPPGPRPRFFGMNILRGIYRDPLSYLERMKREYGGAVLLRMSHIKEYLFTDPELVRAVLVEGAKSFIRYERQTEVFQPVHGNSVLLAEGAEWQRQRRMLQPEFNPRRFAGYAGKVTDAAQLALDRLLEQGDATVDFEHEMNMLAMDAIVRTMFSASIGSETAQVEQAMRDLSMIGYKDSFLPFALPDWLPLPGIRLRKKHTAYLESLIYGFINQRRADPTPRQDLLDMLLGVSDAEAGGTRLGDKEVRDQCMTMFLAGHETTATGLSWAGWCLASNPEMLRRAVAEVDEVLGGRTPTYADLPKLEYLGRVIKETLRLYPPAAAVFLRRAVEDVAVGPWTVPKGALVAVLSLLVHRDERWFPDPLRFDPDRFTEENAKSVPRGAYFPFGNGPRVCIGSNFALMEMALVLAMLLQRCTLEPAPGQTEPGLLLTVVLHPKGGLRLTMRKRADGQCPGKRLNQCEASTS